jgi:alpha-beta hydrolase superfamily lysophospholipase
MGGLVTLRHLIDEEAGTPAPSALALSSPLLGVALAVPAVKDLAARILNRLAPSVTLFNEIHYEYLTRDAEMLKAYEHDSLRHDKISSGIYLGMMENMELVKQNAGRLRLPTLVQAAGAEKIVSLPAIREFFPKIGSPNKKLIVYEGSYHEIFNDLDRERVFKDLDAFLGSVLK